MFDERNEKWIKIYKGVTVTFFWLWIAFGVVAFSDNLWFANIFCFELGYNGYFLGGVVLMLASFIIGYIQLVTNMLVIQFLNNIQTIRDRIENK